ncbi:ComEC/Rec2 family competence protein [Cardinium endosymbiont of Nabis limbatus]|uniref:ComEC/Rec2 family competence protein n=1 Tax=Cardinium endosymbiont of Nabis limbatus TaxID=3066217 RepID=UPI003AF3B57E
MSSATALPLFRLVLVYISGVLWAIYYPADLCITLILLLILSLLYWSIPSSTAAFAWRNPIGLLLICLAGHSNLLLQLAQQKQTAEWIHKYVAGYRVCIEKVYHPFSCKALITNIKDDSGWYNSSTLIQLYLSKKCGYKPQKGDSLLIRGAPTQILPSKKTPPKDRLSALHHPATHRHFLKQIDQDFIFLEPFHKSKKWAKRIAHWCSVTLQKQLKCKEAMALVATLLWGAKEHLDPNLQKAYADTGTIYVLAISGLHVGMFYLLIKAVCSFLFRRIGCLILPELFTLIWLWLYAGLCHFAPPILRATMMITIARLGFLMGRGSNPYNGWFASAFALLLWNPLLLFNCGFQLSYVATLGILYLQPPLHRLITPQNYWLEKIWTATTLSIAAQVSTLPLILYYFKQFPLYFIIANWFVVPAIFMMLMLSLALLVGSHLPIIGTLLGFMLEKLILATNGWVYWVTKWPISTLSACCINGHSVCLLYIVLLAASLFFQYKNLIYPVIISLCTLFYAINQIKITITNQKKCKMICYNNQQLSFTLKDGIETLSCNGSLGPSIDKGHHDTSSNRMQDYAGGIIATWHQKVILTMHKIPPDWYQWKSAKLDVDYLLIDEKWLDDIAVICKALTIKTLVIYTKEVYPLYYHPKIKKRGITCIWLKPGSDKVFTWLYKHTGSQSFTTVLN